jgi:hypothetical protein
MATDTVGACDGIVEITNTRASKYAEGMLNRVIPVFDIPEAGTVKFASAMLGSDLQIAPDPRIKGFAGDIMGRSSTVKGCSLAPPNRARDSFLHRSQ